MSSSLRTRAEATNYRETSLHADVMTFIAGLQAKADPRLFVSSFGTSVQGRELPLLVLSEAGVQTPEQARALGRPILLMQDGIHPGEVEGKEASLAFVRDLLDGQYDDLLAHLTLVVVPLFNPDGNDALDPANRRLDLAKLSGQIGPVVGTRTQSEGINLNRDYMRQQAPEMRALQSRVVQVWEPDLTIDTHATNGSLHRMWMTYDVPHTVASGRAEPIEFMRERMMPAVQAALAKNHGLLAGWYGNFVEDERTLDAHQPAVPDAPVREGWMTYPHNPRFGGNYRGLASRLDLLLECYSYLGFAERTRTTYATILEALRYLAAHRDEVLKLIASCATPRDQIAIRYKLDAFTQPIEIPTHTPRTLEGAESTVSIPYFGNFVGAKVVDRPRGYAVPVDVADHLALHGFPNTSAIGEHDVEVATVTGFDTEGGRKILEASEVGDLEVTWQRTKRTLPADYRLISTDHRAAAIIVYLCEPESDDNVIEHGVIAAPAAGAEYPIWRVLTA